MVWVWIVLGVVYILSPYDLMPDFIPVRGWIDDLIVLILMLRGIHRVRKKTYTGAQDAGARNQQNGNAGQENWKTDRQGQNAPKTPHEILGLPPHASQEEIRIAYRTLAGRYHPDKVAHLGKEFQELAEIRFKEIQSAYDRLAKP